jgi:Zinc-binding domain
MKGRVIFWFQLRQSSDAAAAGANVGTVQFRLFGQRCEKCKIDDYENAMWYPEEVRKVFTDFGILGLTFK